MSRIRVVTGVGTGPTEIASYDAALAEANVHNYNLVTVSSVVPADATVERVGTAPDLGPAGNRLTVVEARATVPTGDPASAVLGWATGPGPGLFYEAGGPDAPETLRAEVERGLSAGKDLRDWEFTDQSMAVASVAPGELGPGADEWTTVVALAIYGESAPI
ncbi:pyruvoyl-dependent arginine decarboxylase [Salinirubrum litoreum]|uniref:arginine decarboxylase n=1 Tax=Salinirubrum litoreum TaxID=1126234 RepID=A0ABD5R5Y7_9EURY|nr:pyruvoyl-dependent arginine decarboxylase [Salinirubrum litoreum]